jgi:hypothetical protein
MWYHIGLYLEVRGKIKWTERDFRETNFDLENWDQSIYDFDFNLYDKRTLKFKIKRKWYPYWWGFINRVIDKGDEYYIWIIEKFWKVKGRFDRYIMSRYLNIFNDFIVTAWSIKFNT